MPSIVKNPAQLVLVSFASLIGLGTALLALPVAADGPDGVGIENDLFLSTSATTVTGLSTVDIGELSGLLGAILRITLAVEGTLATVLFVGFWRGGYENGPIDAAYSAVFHAVATFNNAGISLYSDNLAGFVPPARSPRHHRVPQARRRSLHPCRSGHGAEPSGPDRDRRAPQRCRLLRSHRPQLTRAAVSSPSSRRSRRRGSRCSPP
jgi:hypothetical protein